MIGKKVKRIHPVAENSPIVQGDVYVVKEVLKIFGDKYISLEGIDDTYFLLLSAFEEI